MKATTSSASPSLRSASLKVPPLSTRTLSIFSEPMRCMSSFRLSHSHSVASVSCNCSSLSPSAPSANTTTTGCSPAVRISCDSRGIRALLSRTKRTGWRSTSSRRAFSIGSSARTVPMPVIIAILLRRIWCTLSRAFSPVIHLLSPVCEAIFPSSVIAHFRVTQGIPVVMYFRKTRFCIFSCSTICAAFGSSSSKSTSIPASRSWAMPFPATRGLGSARPTTTRAILRSMIASVQGG